MQARKLPFLISVGTTLANTNCGGNLQRKCRSRQTYNPRCDRATYQTKRCHVGMGNAAGRGAAAARPRGHRLGARHLRGRRPSQSPHSNASAIESTAAADSSATNDPSRRVRIARSHVLPSRDTSTASQCVRFDGRPIRANLASPDSRLTAEDLLGPRPRRTPSCSGASLVSVEFDLKTGPPPRPESPVQAGRGLASVTSLEMPGKSAEGAIPCAREASDGVWRCSKAKTRPEREIGPIRRIVKSEEAAYGVFSR